VCVTSIHEAKQSNSFGLTRYLSCPKYYFELRVVGSPSLREKKEQFSKMNSFKSVALFLAVFLTVALNTESKFVFTSKFCGSKNRGHRTYRRRPEDVFIIFPIRGTVMKLLLNWNVFQKFTPYISLKLSVETIRFITFLLMFTDLLHIKIK
jgi:hypothetical protein